MVVADGVGACPRCGRPPLRAGASAPVVAVRPPGTGRWLVVAAVVVVGVLGLAFAARFGDSVRHRSEDAAGTFRSEHLGLRLSFPAGWRHVRDGDAAPGAPRGALATVFSESLLLRSARFFRGGTPSAPDAELILVVGARAPAITDAAFETWGQRAAATPLTLARPIADLTSAQALELTACDVGPPIPYGAVRCVGTADRRRALVHVWAGADNVQVALFLSTAPSDAALADGTDLVAGLDPG
jgi:hypothetical protein